MTAQPHDDRAGIALAASAYACWGVLPVYWHVLSAVPPLEITVWRVVFCALLVAAIALARGRVARIAAILSTPALLRNLAITAALIACNWTLYVYAVSSRQIVEASLGYYILPLLSAGLGVALLGETLSPMRKLALALAAIAVAVQALALGHLPLIALGLAFSFGIYGYIRKLTPVDPLDGLAIETGFLMPAMLALLAWHGGTSFSAAAPWRDAMLVGCGPVTALPLAMFAAGARRIRLTTLGFLQYLGPSISLLIAVFVFGEPFTLLDGITFGCVWSALVLVAGESRLRWRLKALAGR